MSEKLGHITVARRFLGPPHSANGGYIGGRMAAFIDGPAEITLRKPPPLDAELAVVAAAHGDIQLVFEGEQLAVGNVANVPPMSVEAPTLAQAEAAGERTFPASAHPLPTCFVCGPHRAPDDGLCIHVGPLDAADEDWAGLLATVWTPHPSLADANGVVRPEFLWAALDCPTGYAVGNRPGRPHVLLGRQAVRIDASANAGEEIIVVSRRVAQDGRKHTAHSWLFDRDGGPLGECRAVWIAVSEAVLRGATA